MILTAATAAGLALARSKGIDLTMLPATGKLKIINDVLLGNLTAVPVLLCWTAALFLLRTLSPGVRPRRRWQQPGAVACASGTLVIVLQLIPLVILATTVGLEDASSRGFAARINALIPTIAQNVPWAVEGTWVALFLGAGWRRSGDWLDRLGVIVGIGWILSQLVEQTCILVVALRWI